MRKKITILGSTGSIGTQALEVISAIKADIEVLALSVGNNLELLEHQIQKFSPKKVCTQTEIAAKSLAKKYPLVEFVFGEEGLIELASDKQNDMILVAVSGNVGLKPTMAAIESGSDIALANKETLVMAGEIVMKKAKDFGVNILPVDSEHSAIHQCLHNSDNIKNVRKLIITASGGPFRTSTIEEIKNATLGKTLAHPKWKMGKKITVDSATLINKGLEVIEASHLFGLSIDNIKVVVHPQSIVHSAIEYVDGSVIAQLGLPSMHLPIQYALTYPDRVEGIKTESFDFAKIARLDFEEPDFEKFSCLKLACEAGKQKGIFPIALNAANEEAVFAFLKGEIKLFDISKIVEKILDSATTVSNLSIDDVFAYDKMFRDKTKELIKKNYLVIPHK